MSARSSENKFSLPKLLFIGGEGGDDVLKRFKNDGLKKI